MPCPLHGHSTPFFHLCKLLALEGFTITYISTPRFQPTSKQLQCLQFQSLDVRIALVHDGLPPDYDVRINDFTTYLQHVEMLRRPVEDLIEKIVADRSPPVACILSDSHLGWLQDIANRFYVPRICFLTSSTIEFSVLFHQPMLVEQGVLPFKARSAENSSDIVSCVPGLPPTHRKDFPSFLHVEDSSDYQFQYFMRQISRVSEAERLLVASFYELEPQVMKALGERIKIGGIGPAILLGEEAKFGELEADECEGWLNKQEEGTVVYIAFGTLANLEEKEVKGIAAALEKTQQKFIWAMREGLVEGVANPLPEGFKENAETEGRGLVVSWAQQRRLLRHKSVAGFLTHCGWGSTLEAIATGVPLLCWPLYGDQLLNCLLLAEQWRAAVRIGGNRPLASHHLADALLQLRQCPEYGVNMRKLQAAAQRACSPGGSSRETFRQFVQIGRAHV